MNPPDEPATNGTAARLTYMETRLSRIEAYEPAVMSERINTHMADMAEMKEEFRALRRALYAFAFSVATGAVAGVFVVLTVVK